MYEVLGFALSITIVIFVLFLNIALFVKIWIATNKIYLIEKYMRHWYFEGVPARKVRPTKDIPASNQ